MFLKAKFYKFLSHIIWIIALNVSIYETTLDCVTRRNWFPITVLICLFFIEYFVNLPAKDLYV